MDPAPSLLGGSGGLAEPAPSSFRPTSAGDLAPSGEKAKAEANLAALRVLRRLQDEGRTATSEEQSTLARWSGWGALPGIFDASDRRWAGARAELVDLLDEAEWRAAARTTLNAHYTPLPLAQSLWAAVRRLGFEGGRVLEPGCGAGVFVGSAPTDLDVDLTGVELDPVTAGIASALYPGAAIRAEGFQDTRFPEGWFDLAIGNVPFANVTLADPVHNRGGHSIHNHFLIKSLHLVRPGGLVACFTSRFTLDAQSPAARREIAELADFVGAVRLPAGAVRAVAGTDVVMDLVVLRRREPERARAGPAFERTVDVATADGAVTVNEVFDARPPWVLGELSAVNGQYREGDLTVRPRHGSPLAEQFDAVLDDIVTEATRTGLRVTARNPAATTIRATVPKSGVAIRPWHKEGSLLATGTTFARVEGGEPVPFQPSPANGASELRALIALRDTVFELLDVQSRSWDDSDFVLLRQRMNRQYDAYVGRWGPLNRFSLARTGRTDPETGEEQHRRVFPRMGGFRQDPDVWAVMALEHFDPDTGTATKAGIFDHRVVTPRRPRLGAESPDDALSICLDTLGRLDLDEIARLLGTDASTARSRLGELVYDDPADGSLVPAARYLSGNVRAKLAEARAAAEVDGRFAANVVALEAVHPVDLLPDQIDARLGATWIEPDDVAGFVRDVLGCESVVVEHVPALASWSLSSAPGARETVAMTSEWGTARADALHLVESLCNQSAVTVYDTLPDKRRVQNVPETLAARDKAEVLSDRFAAWVWEDDERARRLAAVYNERFNSVVLPVYDGSHLTFPGLSSDFRPHKHQRDAVWRIVCEPTVGLFHAVGAGKTATMVMAAMEQRRLGLVTKPAFVVPNHMLEQFSRELLQLYPQARVLVADKDDVSAAGRKELIARCATGDWDAVVLTQSSFSRLPVSEEARLRFVQERVTLFRHVLEEAKANGERLSVKKIEGTLLRYEERQEALLANHKKDDGLTFEASGIDYLFVDESQAYKNLEFPTRVQGVSVKSSQRAEDLALKLEVLRETRGDRVTTFATATPIANSVAEMYVVLRYLAPELLAAAGVDTFDAWAATFGRTVTALELAPDGGSYRLHERFARFANVPELLLQFRTAADVLTPDCLGLVVPTLVGGKPVTVVVPPTDTMRAYVASLVERAEAIRKRLVKPHEDNMLKVCGDGAKAALHLRLVGEVPDPEGGKLSAVARNVADLYHRTADHRYTGPDGEPSPRPGAFQLVFCDLGTPQSGGEWSVYSELRDLLVERGVPADRVAFVHDARNDRAKAELFAACRDGRVNVLLGSSEKMGVGTNVQTRGVATHHVDCPWRPDIVVQRNGRVPRQGNQNAEVWEYRYVTEGSFDVYRWQTVERKATFINQIMRGEVDSREIDDIGDDALSYAEVKALATGNPLIMERAGVAGELTRLQRRRADHERDQARLVRTRDASRQRAVLFRRTASACDKAIEGRLDTRGDRFVATVEGTTHRSRPDAADGLRESALDLAKGLRLGDRASACPATVGGVGIEMRAVKDRYGTQVDFGVAGVGLDPIRMDLDDVRKGTTGLLTKLENRVHNLDSTRDELLSKAVAEERQVEQAEARIGQPFEFEVRLTGLVRRLAEIDRELMPLEDSDVENHVDPQPAAVGEFSSGAEVGV